MAYPEAHHPTQASAAEAHPAGSGGPRPPPGAPARPPDPRPADAPGDDASCWVSLRGACAILRASESSVRRWADSGKIPVYRTPGGHRRFPQAELLALAGGHPEQQALTEAAVTRIRRQLDTGPDETPWYHDFDSELRAQLRPLGRRLVQIVDDYLSGGGDRWALDGEVDQIGASYGRALYQRRLPLSQAIQAVVFFRRSLDETAKQLAQSHELPDADAARAREEIARLADRVLVGVAAAYDHLPAEG